MEGRISPIPNPESPEFDGRAKLLLSNGGIVRSADGILGAMDNLDPSDQTSHSAHELLSRLEGAFSDAVELQAHSPGSVSKEQVDAHFIDINSSITTNLDAIKKHGQESLPRAVDLAVRSAQAIQDPDKKVDALINTTYELGENFDHDEFTRTVLHDRDFMFKLFSSAEAATMEVKDPETKVDTFVDLAKTASIALPEGYSRQDAILKSIGNAIEASRSLNQEDRKGYRKTIAKSAIGLAENSKSGEEALSILELSNTSAKMMVETDDIGDYSKEQAVEQLLQSAATARKINGPKAKTNMFIDETINSALQIAEQMKDSPNKSFTLLNIAGASTPYITTGANTTDTIVLIASEIMMETGNSNNVAKYIESIQALVSKDIGENQKTSIIREAQRVVMNIPTTYEESTRKQGYRVASEKVDMMILVADFAKNYLKDNGTILMKECLDNTLSTVDKIELGPYTREIKTNSYERISDYARIAAGESASQEDSLAFYDIAIKAAKSMPDADSGFSKIIEVAQHMKQFTPETEPDKHEHILDTLEQITNSKQLHKASEDFRSKMSWSAYGLIRDNTKRLDATLKILGGQKNPGERTARAAIRIAGNSEEYQEHKALLEFAIDVAKYQHGLGRPLNMEPFHEAARTYKNIGTMIADIVGDKKIGKSYLMEVVDLLPKDFKKQVKEEIDETY